MFNYFDNDYEQIDYNKPYESGNWHQFFDAFLSLIRENKLALHSLAVTSNIHLVEIDSDEETLYMKYMPQGQALTAFIDGNYDINVSERFLIDQKMNVYNLVTLLTHEIMHYTLGHIDEYDLDRELGIVDEREHLIKNTVQDAVINSMISKSFKFDPKYTDMFEKMYDKGKLPEAFLRPLSNIEQVDAKMVYENLYRKTSATMNEIRNAIEDNQEEEDGGEYVLLGGHGLGGRMAADGINSGSGDKDAFDNAAKDVVGEVVENNKDARNGDAPGQGCDPNATDMFVMVINEFIDGVDEVNFIDQVPYMSQSGTFYSYLEKSLIRAKSDVTIRGVYPTPYDRRQLLYKLLGIPQFFYRNRLPDTAVKAIAYIDVSGSTQSYHKVFLSSIRYSAEHFEHAYPFSTYVDVKTTFDEFCDGKYETSGGTNDCWARHMIENDIKNAVVYTDGDFSGDSWKELSLDPEVNIVIVYTSDYINETYFRNIENRVLDKYKVDPHGHMSEVR
jgi:hypothetical protein